MTAETHPQRAQIIEMLMDTSRKISVRQIAATITPPLDHSTIARFRAKLLGHATRNMRGSNEVNRSIKDLAAVSNGTGATDKQRAQVQERLREELQHTVVALRTRQESWISEAERRPVLDKLGNPVKDSDGTVVRVLEHKALAAHTRNTLNSVELQAKLAGLLVNDQAPAGDNTLVLSLPRVTVVLQQGATQAQQPATRVIDVSSEPQDVSE